MALVTYLPRTMPTLGGDQLYLQQELAAIANAIGALNNTLSPSWTAYTPVITASSGSFTAVSATGRYLKVGKTVSLQVDISITTNGTANTAVLASLPFAAVGNSILAGREMNATGIMLSGTTSNSVLVIETYANAYPAANGYRLIVSGIYECV
jgi:hypothetical protein